MRFARQERPNTLVFQNALPRHCAKPIRVGLPFKKNLDIVSLIRPVVAKIDAVQAEYSAFETVHETDGLIEACKELGVAYVAYSPLGHGWLVDNFDYKSPDDFAPDDFRRSCQCFPIFRLLT
jgi:aryl-alcohol dehydrogenase-like predicted oxidoreductase